MEYIPGCSLEEFLSQARPSLASILRVGIDVAGALAVARQEHVVHGDVKAANILVTRTGRAKLTDFGIARIARDGEAGRRGGVSPSALSPEQVHGEPLDERADLFALGCLLYRMISGEHPFFRHGRLDTGLLLKRSPRPLVEVVSGDVELPERLAALVDELLQKDPRSRPPSTRRVRHVLRLLSRDLPLSSRDSLLREARPFFRRELVEDLPPPIPEELGQRGRSALLPDGGGGARLRHWLQGLRWPARSALLAGALVLAATPFMIVQGSKVTPVRFDRPETSFTGGMNLPREISEGCLLRQVK
jgi:serine/threonine protein kinase